MKKILSMISVFALALVMAFATSAIEANAYFGCTDCTRAVYYVSTYEEFKAACEATRYDRTIIFENDIIVGYDDIVSAGSAHNYLGDYKIDIKGDTTVVIDLCGHDYKVKSRNTARLFDITENASAYFISTNSHISGASFMLDMDANPTIHGTDPNDKTMMIRANTTGSVYVLNAGFLMGSVDHKESGTADKYITYSKELLGIYIENASELNIASSTIENYYENGDGIRINDNVRSSFHFTMTSSAVNVGQYAIYAMDASKVTMNWNSYLNSWTGSTCFYTTEIGTKGAIKHVLGMNLVDGTPLIASSDDGTTALNPDNTLMLYPTKLAFVYQDGALPSTFSEIYHDTSLILPQGHIFRVKDCGAWSSLGSHAFEMDADGFAYCKCGHEYQYQVTLSQSAYTYDGTAKTPEVTLKIGGRVVDSGDYEVEYSNNVNAGTATVTITGRESAGLEGTVTKTFKINQKAVTPTVTLSKTSFTYNGKVQKPTVTVKNGSTTMSSANYTVTYSSGCTNAGTYKVTVTLKGNYKGTVTKTFKITAKAITPTVTLSKTTYTYNGKVQKPKVTVKNGTTTLSSSNYTVKYSGTFKNAGVHKVTVTLKGNYSGSVTKSVTIKPKATTLSKLTAGTKKLTVVWKKLTTQTTGYQIQYSTSAKFTGAKTVSVPKNTTTKKSITGLKSGKKYYVRIRTYKTVTVDGKSTKVYSSWSKLMSVKVK